MEEGRVMINESKAAIIQLDTGVRNKGTVTNIIICDERGINGLILPENTAIWDCTDYLCSIGDRWEDGIFTHPDGTDVAPYESPEQTQINYLKEDKVSHSEITEITDAYKEGVQMA